MRVQFTALLFLKTAKIVNHKLSRNKMTCFAVAIKTRKPNVLMAHRCRENVVLVFGG